MSNRDDGNTSAWNSLYTGDESDPSIAYTIGIYMENLVDKLKLLNYEVEYVENLRMKNISRHYFLYQTNPGEQFFSFISIAAWLIKKLGKHFDQPQEYDDPNSVISNILEKLKELKATDLDCPPNKLKQGCGIHVILVLTFLTDAALKSIDFTFKEPSVIESVEEITEVDGAEIFLDKVEEEMIASVSDDEDQPNPLEADDLQLTAMENLHMLELRRPEKVLQADNHLDLMAWQSEVERVTPALKISYNLDTTDWRLHLVDSSRCLTEASTNLTLAKDHIDVLLGNIKQDLEKINSKETHTGYRVEKQLTDLKTLKTESASLQATYDSVNGGVKERMKTLATVHEEMEAMRQEMEERGANMTDGSQLVVLKKAMSTLKTEITVMKLRIAVLEHCLLQGRIKKKNQLQREMLDALASDETETKTSL